jgi:hypothetical protein
MLEVDGGYGDLGFDPESEFDPEAEFDAELALDPETGLEALPEPILARGTRPPGADEDTRDELDAVTVPGLTAETEALIEMLAAGAESAPTEQEACSLVGGLTIHILTAAPFVVRSVAPVLIRRSTHLVRALRRTPARRHLIGTVPLIVKRTAATLVRKAAKRRPVNARVAARVLGKQTRRVLGSPARRSAALRAVRNHRQRVARMLSSRRLTRRAEAGLSLEGAWP